MATSNPTIFRPEALEYRLQNRTVRRSEVTFPRLMAHRVMVVLWILLGVLAVGGGIACLPTVPVSAAGLAIVTTETWAERDAPVVAVLMQAQHQLLINLLNRVVVVGRDDHGQSGQLVCHAPVKGGHAFVIGLGRQHSLPVPIRVGRLTAARSLVLVRQLDEAFHITILALTRRVIVERDVGHPHLAKRGQGGIERILGADIEPVQDVVAHAVPRIVVELGDVGGLRLGVGDRPIFGGAVPERDGVEFGGDARRGQSPLHRTERERQWQVRVGPGVDLEFEVVVVQVDDPRHEVGAVRIHNVFLFSR